MNWIQKQVMALQVFLLKRNWLGSHGNYVMVITTRSRIHGNPQSRPIGYFMDGPHFIAYNPGGKAEWFQNVLQEPEAMLIVKGERIAAYGAEVTDTDELWRLFELYQQELAGQVPRLFGIPADAPKTELRAVLATRRFISFTRLMP